MSSVAMTPNVTKTPEMPARTSTDFSPAKGSLEVDEYMRREIEDHVVKRQRQWFQQGIVPVKAKERKGMKASFKVQSNNIRNRLSHYTSVIPGSMSSREGVPSPVKKTGSKIERYESMS